MKLFVSVLILLFFTTACHEEKAGNVSVKLNRDSLVKDSISKTEKVRIISIDSEIAIEKTKQNFLKTKFDLVNDLCSNKTYCHKNFWGSYSIRDHCLVCGLDSLGQIFLVANTFEAYFDKKKQKQYNQSEIAVEIKDSIFQTDSVKNTYHSICDSKIHLQYVCACVPEQRSFFNGSDNGILKLIASHPDDKIVFYFTYKGNKISPKFILEKRYKTGIAESVQFSETYQKIDKLDKEKLSLLKK
jgi:hypothetical protein